jgi:hypothetical protein
LFNLVCTQQENQSKAKRQRQPGKVKSEKLSVKDQLKKQQEQLVQQNKKRHKKQQELFEEDFDDDDDEDSLDDDLEEDELDLDEDETSNENDLIKNIKMEDLETDEAMMFQENASSAKASKSRSGNNGNSGSSSFVNSDSLFDLMMSTKNRDSFFWQYNIQSKGPKTKKVLTLRNKDPHLHRDFFDPVFQLQSLNSRNGKHL